MEYICPVCGYPKLKEQPYDKDGNPSYVICDCCGFEFGFDDSSKNFSYKEYRKKWIEDGANWFSPSKKPGNWSLTDQLKNIESYSDNH